MADLVRDSGPERAAVTLAEVSEEQDMAPVSWLHMLPGDLFAGRWIHLDSRKRDVHPWLVSLGLVVTFASGSIGFLLYLLLRVWAAFLKRPRLGN